MTKTRSTKRALVLSALALVMCITMLVGTTFAWFTDVVTSAGNKIIAGNLDIRLLMHDGDEYVDISDSDKPIFGEGSIAQDNNAQTLWEPGKTQVAYLAIENYGSLALRYTVALDVENVSKDLYKVMQYTITPDAQYEEITSWDADNGASVVTGKQVVTTADVVMNPGDIHYFALSIHMDELAGNEYQNGEVDFDLTVLATQATVESDSFDNQYDKDATFPDVDTVVIPENSAEDEILGKGNVKVTIPAGSPEGVYKLEVTNPNEETVGNQFIYSADVVLTKDGVVVGNNAARSTGYPVEVELGAGSTATKVTLEGVDLNYTNNNGNVSFNTSTFGALEITYSKIDTWDGTIDTSWYNDTDTTFTLTATEQLAGLAKLVDDGNTMAGKTIKLGIDLDLYCLDANDNRVFFEPIGDASNADFSGVFDGNGKTIYNLRQDCNSKHLALFGAVYEGTVKNLIIDGALIENNGNGYAGAIAAYAGASNFENITLRNTTVVNYNHNTGGIVAWCSNNGTTTTFEGINIESTTTIGSWWGSPDSRVGGIVGAMNTENHVVIKNSTVACRLDVYNDVVANYQWGNYRMAGMVVGDVRDTHDVDGRTEANPARVTCENVTVIFGDWANYHYCESASYGTPSYADEGEYKFNRVEAGLGYGGVDTSACDHAEDETHYELIAFDCLFGARDGKGIYSINSFEGVTVTHN